MLNFNNGAYDPMNAMDSKRKTGKSSCIQLDMMMMSNVRSVVATHCGNRIQIDNCQKLRVKASLVWCDVKICKRVQQNIYIELID